MTAAESAQNCLKPAEQLLRNPYSGATSTRGIAHGIRLSIRHTPLAGQNGFPISWQTWSGSWTQLPRDYRCSRCPDRDYACSVQSEFCAASEHPQASNVSKQDPSLSFVARTEHDGEIRSTRSHLPAGAKKNDQPFGNGNGWYNGLFQVLIVASYSAWCYMSSFFPFDGPVEAPPREAVKGIVLDCSPQVHENLPSLSPPGDPREVQCLWSIL